VAAGEAVSGGFLIATYYVDYVNGLDANNGLGPDASHATNKPWKTLGKLLGAAGMASGDTAYLAPGSFREVVTVAMTSATAETRIIGDYANERGFKTSGGVAVTPGPVVWTAYTTNDRTAPSGTCLLTLAGRDYLTFRNIAFVGSSNATAQCVTSTATSTNLSFVDCSFTGYATTAGILIALTCGTSVSVDLLVDRCHFFTTRGIAIAPTFAIGNSASDTAWDSNITIRNSVCVGGGTFVQCGGGAGSGPYPGGVLIQNCFWSGTASLVLFGANVGHSGSISYVYNCVGIGSTTAVLSKTTETGSFAGGLAENYCLLAGSTPRTNVAAGANSISDGSYAALFHYGQERIWGALVRQFGEPTASSPLLGFGNDGTQTATDMRGTGHIRPAGGASALPATGALERSNTFIADTAPIGAGGSAIKVTGPGYAEFLVPVPARAITISCKVKWDATYAGTKPQLQIDANGRNGVAAETITATVAATNIETLTLSAFTPTNGTNMVTIRVLSNDTNGAGVLQVDDFSVTG